MPPATPLQDVAIEASGVYVTGTAASNQFPTTAGAFDTSVSGASDVYVTKLDPGGNAQLYSTVLGGSGADLAGGIAVGPGGNAYVTGTGTTGYPTTAGAYAGTTGKPVFVTKLDPTGGALVYSTRFGGPALGAPRPRTRAAASRSTPTGNAYIGGGNRLRVHRRRARSPIPPPPAPSIGRWTWIPSGPSPAAWTRSSPS